MTIQMTIIGLGQVGASIGLALDKYKNEIARTGHDREYTRAQKAQKMGATDRSVANLPASVESADIVVLAIPLDEVRRTLEVIAPVLKEGCTILDTSTNKISIAGWVRELLPAERFYVTMAPTLNPSYLHEYDISQETAHADLFENGLMVISSAPGTHGDAVKLASDISLLLGARPFFADPYEIDGLLAASDILPKLTAAALLHAATDLPSWREGRKVAGRPFAEATEPILQMDEDTELGQAALLNPENTLRALDNLIGLLGDLREMIAKGHQAELKDFLQAAQDQRQEWWQLRQSGNWDRLVNEPNYPTAGEVFGRLIGLRPRSKDKNRK
jgi:prephenate dehydrogenase